LKAVLAFEAMGHNVTLTEDGNVFPKHNGVPTDTSKRLIAEMRTNKDAVVEYLKARNFIKDAAESLRSVGYAKFWSKSLTNEVYIIRDWGALTSLPDGVVAFTAQEIRTLSLITHTPEELQLLADEKRLLIATQKAQLQPAQQQSSVPDPGSRGFSVEEAAALFSGQVYDVPPAQGAQE